MEVKIQIDDDDGQILATYFRVRSGIVARTVQISEGECYVDEDANGGVLGVEMLVPGTLSIVARRVAERYKLPQVEQAVEQVRKQLSVA